MATLSSAEIRPLHFAAWEQPELFSGELRAAFRSLRAAARPEGRFAA